jgi:hypothetical protein
MPRTEAERRIGKRQQALERAKGRQREYSELLA